MLKFVLFVEMPEVQELRESRSSLPSSERLFVLSERSRYQRITETLVGKYSVVDDQTFMQIFHTYRLHVPLHWHWILECTNKIYFEL